MVERFKETGRTMFKSISALSRGILKRKNNRDTIHFNADASNTELLPRTSHSANQLTIYGAVSSWCEEFGLRPNEREREPTSERFVAKENEQPLQNVKPYDVNYLVPTPRSDDPEPDCEKVLRTSGHQRKKSNLQKFAKMRLSGNMGWATRPLQT